MINYRQIFNPSYNYIGLIVIVLLVLTIIIIKKDILASIQEITESCLIAGIVILIMNLILNFMIDFFVFNSYKVFIEIITNNVIKNLYFYSITIIIISSIIKLIINTTKKIEY